MCVVTVEFKKSLKEKLAESLQAVAGRFALERGETLKKQIGGRDYLIGSRKHPDFLFQVPFSARFVSMVGTRSIIPQ